MIRPRLTYTYTYTYVLLAVSDAAYAERAAKLRAAAYHHCFMEDGAVDRHGLALVRERDEDAGETSKG